MWELKSPQPVKLIVGILSSDSAYLTRSAELLSEAFGRIDLASEVWPFTFTNYYQEEMGDTISRQFLSFEPLLDPGALAGIKHQTNAMEQTLARELPSTVTRPVNLDPGFIETSKLVLATTKNFSHRIYIGQQMYAEVTLSFHKGSWIAFPYTFPDYQQASYQQFFSQVRERLRDQSRQSGAVHS